MRGEVEMAPKRSMTKEEKQWRAQDDARTLAYAEEIATDPARLKAAKVEATRMAEDAVKTANRFVKVAKVPGGQVAAKAAPKSTPKAKPAAKRPAPKKAAAKRPAAKRNPRGRK